MSFFSAVAAIALASAPTANSDTIAYRNTHAVEPGAGSDRIAALAAHTVPTPAQLAALTDGYIAFVHFGPNTFTRREWGTGKEDPAVFAPSGLDTDQWVKAMRDAGMTKVVITAKHHDGFVVWPSRYTRHGIMSSPFEGGKGDIVGSLAESCRKYGLKLGVYLSPADLYQIENPDGLYGNLSPKTTRVIPRPVKGARPFKSDVTFEFDEIDDYNEYFLNQLYELLTDYGPIDEVWFDGAHPKRKGGQTYNYEAWRKLIRTLAPNAVIFGREDIRWGGNESGATRYAERNVVGYPHNPDTATVFADMTAPDLGSLDALAGAPFIHYQPAEIDTSIREGWFYRDEDKQKSRSADDIFDIYERSVGGNSIFILNIPPDRSGRFAARDVEALADAGRRIRETYGTDLLAGSELPSELADTDIHTFVEASEPVVVKLPKATTINRLTLSEPVADRGERIDSVAVDALVEGVWQHIASAPNVGFKRILRFPDVTTDKLRIRVIDSRLEPYLASVSGHYYAERPATLAATRSADGMVTIAPAPDTFGWKRTIMEKPLTPGTEIRYTTDGSVPGPKSTLYTAPFKADNQTVKAVAMLNGQTGPVSSSRFGYIKDGWRLLGATGSADRHPAQAAFDSDPSTAWISDGEEMSPTIAIDLGTQRLINGLIYTPVTSGTDGMIAKAIIEVSPDGGRWTRAGEWDFGNLVNDPTPREYHLDSPVDARFVRITTVATTSGTPVSAIAELDIF